MSITNIGKSLTSKDLKPKVSYAELSEKQQAIVDYRVELPEATTQAIASLVGCTGSYVSAVETAYYHIIVNQSTISVTPSSVIASLLGEGELEDAQISIGSGSSEMIDVTTVAEAYYSMGYDDGVEDAYKKVRAYNDE